MKMLSSLSALVFLACTGATAGFPTEAAASASAGSYTVEVIDQWGGQLPTWWHGGRTWVLGEQGQRYRIRVRNRSPQRVEAVISVDGRDAIDGKPAHTGKPGYIVPPWGEVAVDGFRVSMRDVATFRFAAVEDSYAAQMGNDRNVGVIGVAIFSERRYVPPPQPVRRPWDDRPNCGGCERDQAHAGEARQGAGKAGGQAAPARSESAKADAAPRSEGERSKRAMADSAAEERPGLGTRFGERRESRVQQVDFLRRHPSQPDAVLSIRYNDAPGLVAAGVQIRPPRPTPLQREHWRREHARAFADQPNAFAAPPAGWDGDW